MVPYVFVLFYSSCYLYIFLLVGLSSWRQVRFMVSELQPIMEFCSPHVSQCENAMEAVPSTPYSYVITDFCPTHHSHGH